MSPVPLNIANAIMKGVTPIVDNELAFDTVANAHHLVSTLHEGHHGKGPHNVVRERRDALKTEGSMGFDLGRVNVQRNSAGRKAVFAYHHLVFSSVERNVSARAGEVVGLLICDNLNGGAFRSTRVNVQRRNQRHRFPFVLLLKVQALKVRLH